MFFAYWIFPAVVPRSLRSIVDLTSFIIVLFSNFGLTMSMSMTMVMTMLSAHCSSRVNFDLSTQNRSAVFGIWNASSDAAIPMPPRWTYFFFPLVFCSTVKKKWLRRRHWRRWRLFAIRFRWRAFTLRANGILVSFIRSLLTSLEFMRENGKGRVSERARENRRCKQDICTLTRTSRPHVLAIVIIQIFAVPPMCGRYADRASRVLILINRSINMLHASCGLLYVIRRSGHWRNK